MNVSRAIKHLKATGREWYQDKALRLSAAMAYYSIFSIAPCPFRSEHGRSENKKARRDKSGRAVMKSLI